MNRKVATLATKAGLKAEQDKIAKLETCNFNYFLGKIFFGDDSSQNMFVYQPTLNTPELETENLLIVLVGSQKEYIIPNS